MVDVEKYVKPLSYEKLVVILTKQKQKKIVFCARDNRLKISTLNVLFQRTF